MTPHVSRSQALHRKLSLLLAGLWALTAPVSGQELRSNEAVKAPAFAVVSLNPNHSGNEVMKWNFNDDGYLAENITIRQLILTAYSLNFQNEVSGLPRWTDSDRFDIQAKMDEDTATAFQKLNPQDRWKQIQRMLQALLVDRMSLRVHHEAVVLPVYALIVAKGGCKLKDSQAVMPLFRAKGHGQIDFQKAQIQDLIFGLSSEADLDRRVIDRTGLTGRYDISLIWATSQLQGSPSAGPSIFTALQEQLGLKLDAEKAAVDVIVIDNVEPPSPN
ncbi:MAG: TIGR03435 family protein [Acidobacteriaceae bacterium]|jgi:uncharacterized protein (TIGR03435 family)